MTNSLTYTRHEHANNGLSCIASGRRVQLHADNIADQKRRCWGCGRMMHITPDPRPRELTLGYQGTATISAHRPHT